MGTSLDKVSREFSAVGAAAASKAPSTTSTAFEQVISTYQRERHPGPLTQTEVRAAPVRAVLGNQAVDGDTT